MLTQEEERGRAFQNWDTDVVGKVAETEGQAENQTGHEKGAVWVTV